MTTVDQVITEAERQLGKPYKFGAEGPGDFDCSGLVQFSYGAAGISLPRTADEQYHATTRVSTPVPGDLVFYVDDKTGTATHVAIYIGAGQMIEAPDVGKDVRIHSVYQLDGHTTAYGRVSGLAAGAVNTLSTVTTALNTTGASFADSLGLSSLFVDIEEIVFEAVFGLLGVVMIFQGMRKLAGARKSKEEDD